MGWTYNTAEPAPTLGPTITGLAIAMTILSLVAVGLRVYVRFKLIKAADDYIILATWVVAAGFAVVTIIQTKWGLGLENIGDLPEENVFNFGLIQYVGAPFYILSILGFKLVLLFSYLRFLPKGAYRMLCIAVIVACIMFHLAFLLVQLNLCQPVAKQWDTTITDGSCLPGVAVYTSMASITIVFDVVVMLLPFPILMKSQIQKRKKAVLLGLFALGMFITIIQIVRIQTISRLVNYTDSAPLILWSVIENNLGIIVTCVPTLSPLFKYFSDRSGESRSGNSKRDIGSAYAMQKWKAGRAKGCNPLESGNDDNAETSSFEGQVLGHVTKGNSTEFILESGQQGIGITKRVEVVITRV
ncbi:hypothetical protein OQA88_6351 [Cercophora sp. LCS_1]